MRTSLLLPVVALLSLFNFIDLFAQTNSRLNPRARSEGSQYYISGQAASVAPSVVGSVNPAPNSTGVSNQPTITVSFLRAIDPATITQANVFVHGALSEYHNSLVSYDSLSRLATITPNTKFFPGERVSFTIVRPLTRA